MKFSTVLGETLRRSATCFLVSRSSSFVIDEKSNWAAGRTPGDPQAEIDHEEVDSMASSMREKIVNCIDALTKLF